ncbi:MAG: hypothetical protein ABL955_12680, partial [Elusimicrobiota bacterium]
MLIAVGADDAKFRAQLVGLLEGGGHKVMELAGKAGALASLRSAKPHMLVVCCSDGGAPDFIRSIRAQPDMRLLPILCVDPKASSSDTVSFLDAGAETDDTLRPRNSLVCTAETFYQYRVLGQALTAPLVAGRAYR